MYAIRSYYEFAEEIVADSEELRPWSFGHLPDLLGLSGEPVVKQSEGAVGVDNWQNPAYMDSNLREEMFLESNYFYLSKLIYPHPLLFYYGYNMFPVETGFYLKYFISIIVLVLLMAIAFRITSYNVCYTKLLRCLFLRYNKAIAISNTSTIIEIKYLR